MENAGFPNGAQVLVKLPMEPGIPQEMGMPSKDKMPNNHMRPVLKEPRGNCKFKCINDYCMCFVIGF